MAAHDEEELERARNDSMCSVHPNKTVEMFCVGCDFLICMDCKLAGHLHHNTQSLHDARKDAEEQLSTNKLRLRQETENIQGNIKERATDLKDFTEKQDVVEKKIRDRHAKIISEADKYLKEALKSLQETSKTPKSSLSRELKTAKNHKKTLHTLKNKIDTALENGESVKRIKLAQELRTGPDSQQSVQKMEVKPVQHVSRPVHVADLPHDDAMFVSMRNFIGQGRQVTYPHADPEVRVTEQFRCGDHTDSVVFCVCPSKSKVAVSFESSPWDKELNKKATLTDRQETSRVKLKGTHSLRSRGSDKSISRPFSDKQTRHTYVKCCASDTHYGLTNTGGNANVCVDEVLSSRPFKSKTTVLFRIDCGPHCAVDVNSTEDLLAVVEESGAASETRHVKLFPFQPQKDVRPLSLFDLSQPQESVKPLSPFDLSQPEESVRPPSPFDLSQPEESVRPPSPFDLSQPEESVRPLSPFDLSQPEESLTPLPATDTYQSPLTPCRPADVCFFTLGGQEVLLIADELNDAIHVAEVKGNRLTFSRFLAPGCPLLVQPTALNTDRQGRLWVGCRGGRVLTVEPTRQAAAVPGTSGTQ